MLFSSLFVWSSALSMIVAADTCNHDSTYSQISYIDGTLDPQFCSTSGWNGYSGTTKAAVASVCSCLHPGLNTAAATTTTLATTTTKFTGSIRTISLVTAPPTLSTTTITRPTDTACGISGLSQSYINLALKHHNIHRYNHSAPFVNWDCNLASYAQTLALRCSFGHDNTIGGGGYGQNLAVGADWNHVGISITDLWYNSEKDNYAPYYGQATPGGANFSAVFNDESHPFGHFTAVVWNATTKIGCFTNWCPNGVENGGGAIYVTVCNYSPQGNIADQWAKNVFPPRKTGTLPTINGSYVPADSYI